MKNTKASAGKQKKLRKEVPPASEHNRFSGETEKDPDDLSHEELKHTGKGDLASEDPDDLAHRELETDEEGFDEDDIDPRRK
jgi:hypothetical protein